MSTNQWQGEDVRGLIGADAFRRIEAAFRQRAVERLDHIRAALSSGDLETVARQAHALKGASATFGHAELSLLASALDEAARTRAPDLSQCVERLSMAVASIAADATRGD